MPATPRSVKSWLAAATNGYMLAMVSGLPAWQPPPPSMPTAVAGAIPVYTTPSSISHLAPGTSGYVMTMVGVTPGLYRRMFLPTRIEMAGAGRRAR